jgi:hypothetical protein
MGVQERQFAKSGGLRSLWRACAVKTLRGRGEPNPWPEDHVIDLVLRAAQDPTSLANTPELAAVLSEFVTALVPYSAAAGLFGMSTSLNFGGAASIALTSISDLPQADWVREGAPIPVVQGVSAAVSLTPFKLATIVALTNEMLRSGNAEAMIREALLNNMGPSLDRNLFSAAAGVPGLRPPGLLFGVATSPADAGNNSEAMIKDLETLVDAIAAYGGNGRIAFICSAKHSVRLVKSAVAEKGFPTFISSALTGATPPLIAVASAAVAVTIDPPSIDSSGETVLHMDDAPLPINEGGTAATPVRSTWQTDSTGLRFVLPVSWVLRAPAVSWLTPNW